MKRSEVIEHAARMLTDRGENGDIALVRSWADDPDQAYRKAAESALACASLVERSDVEPSDVEART